MDLFSIMFSGLAFASTLFGGLMALRYRKNFGILAAFAAGVLIAVPMFDLLPETFNLAMQVGVPLEQVMYVAAIGFIFLMVVERYLSVQTVCEQDGTCKNIHHPKGGVYGAAELSAHSFMDGLAIGFGFQFSFDVGIIIALAVIAHDFSDGLNTVTVMLKSGNSTRSALKMLALDATTPVLGAVSTLFFMIPESYLVLILPFFAGGFIYLGAAELLPASHEKNRPLISIIFTLLGFLLIFLLTGVLGI